MPDHGQPSPIDDRHRLDLRADCERCFGLCCVALPFTASADFAFDKDAGVPCPHLRTDFGCGIHRTLRPNGFPGCSAYDCFGAGQKVAQVTFAGRDWRASPETAGQMFQALPVMQQLHELLWYLTEALTLAPARPLRGALEAAREAISALTLEPAALLLALDVDVHRGEVDSLLLRTSELVRAEGDPHGPDRRHADLMGADLHGVDLRRANLRGAYLIRADLRGADLRLADVIGADFRGADVRSADLSTSMFLTQSQIGAADGDGRTNLPAWLRRPTHWAR